jgi:Tfp pilus assembly protein PilF
MYRKAIQLRPDYADAYNNLGIDLGRQGKLEEAVAALKKAIEINSAFSEAYCNLGIAYKQQGKINEAKDMLQRAVSINPKNTGAKKLLDLVNVNSRN